MSRREALEARLKTLTEDYEALSAASENAIDPVIKRRQKRELRKISTEMDDIEEELERIGEGGNSQDRFLDIQAKLPEIDFGEIETALNEILNKHWEDGCAVLLLFQKSASMGGEWCAARIRELLSRKTGAGRFRHIQIEFQPSEQMGQMTVLRRLGQELGVEPGSRNVIELAAYVVEKLTGSLQNGAVIMIECRRCDYLLKREQDILHWMLEDFWSSLVRSLAVVAERYLGVKIVTLLFVDGPLPENCLDAEKCCKPEQFCKDKLLEMPLTTWSREDIKQWIVCYSGLSLSRTEVDIMTDKIYNDSLEGLPTLVVHGLQQECCPGFTG